MYAQQSQSVLKTKEDVYHWTKSIVASYSRESESRASEKEIQILREMVNSLSLEVRKLKQQPLSVRKVSNAEAQAEIISYIKKVQANGRSSVSDAELVDALHLPLEQVSLLLSDLFDEK